MQHLATVWFAPHPRCHDVVLSTHACTHARTGMFGQGLADLDLPPNDRLDHIRGTSCLRRFAATMLNLKGNGGSGS